MRFVEFERNFLGSHKVYINDIDRAIFAFWHSVVHEPDRLCRLGWIAAAAMSSPGTKSPFVERCLHIYRPFIEAFAAGLWLFWVLEDSVLAVARPALKTNEGQLHCEDGPAVDAHCRRRGCQRESRLRRIGTLI